MFHRIAENKDHDIFDLLVAHRHEDELKIIRVALNQTEEDDPTQGNSTPLSISFPD